MPISTSVLSRACVATCLVMLASQWGVSATAADAGCTFRRDGSAVAIEWNDDGGRHVLRRNGRWLTTPGSGVATYTDTSAPTNATYLVRTHASGSSTDRVCIEENLGDPGGPVVPLPTADRRYVVHVSIDGLRSDHVTTTLMSNLSSLASNGVSTMNARTDPSATKTLPNHTSQFTGQFVWGPAGHRVTMNEDPGGSVHDLAGRYVPSVFDVVHDHGGRTVVYAGKDKFYFLDRSWNSDYGASDTVGGNNGRDKIDVFVKTDPASAASPFVDHLTAGNGDTYGFFHIRTADSAGHTYNWGTSGYREGVREADGILGDLIAELEAAGVYANTTIIVTSDHGGPTGQGLHSDPGIADNYTVPFVVSGRDVARDRDLYALNTASRRDPGAERPNKDGVQPIRGHDAPNLALDLLGLPAIPGSVVNGDQSLRVK